LAEFITRTMLDHDDWCRTKIGMQPYTRDDRNPSWRSAKQAREIEGRHLAEALAARAGSAGPAVPPDPAELIGAATTLLLAHFGDEDDRPDEARVSGHPSDVASLLYEQGLLGRAAVPDLPSAPDEAVSQ
jgi:hypothetical protein